MKNYTYMSNKQYVKQAKQTWAEKHFNLYNYVGICLVVANNFHLITLHLDLRSNARRWRLKNDASKEAYFVQHNKTKIEIIHNLYSRYVQITFNLNRSIFLLIHIEDDQSRRESCFHYLSRLTFMFMREFSIIKHSSVPTSKICFRIYVDRFSTFTSAENYL